MKLVPSTEADIERLTAWIKSDPYHKDCLNPIWWITGVEGSLLSFRLDDDHGPLCYVRLDQDILTSLIRLHTQFAPRQDVSKLRLVKGMLKCVPIVEKFSREQKAIGIVFQSTSESLIQFMDRKFGFIYIDKTDDYVLYFQSENTV